MFYFYVFQFCQQVSPLYTQSEFKMINENPALSEVIPLEVHIKEIKTKNYGM